MSALNDIVTWSSSHPVQWIRDALRRVVTQVAISETDIAELSELCKGSHGLCSPDKVLPLADNDLSSTASGGTVVLLSLQHISDVNALAPGETLTFAESGLTVVYGDNGAGKSGYARILKRACRARGSNEPILGNALSDDVKGPATAKLRIAVDGTEQEVGWNDGGAGPVELTALSVFDSTAAQIYVADKTEVRFRPFGLDVVDRLAAVCDGVRQRLVGERDALSRQNPLWPQLSPGTAASRLVQELTALTPPGSVDAITTISPEEDLEFQRLAETLAAARAEDPVRRGRELQLQADRIAQYVKSLRAAAAAYASESMSELLDLRTKATESGTIASDLAKGFGDIARLPGLGQPAWRQLWEAAERFSKQTAYPSETFPHTGQDSLCVLCQQTIDSAARDRLTRFGEFVRADAQRSADQASRAVETKQRGLPDVTPLCTAPVRQELATLAPAATIALDGFLGQLQQVRDSLTQPTLLGLSALPPVESLESSAAELRRRATALASAADPAARKLSEVRYAELNDRRILSGWRPHLHAEIVRRGRLNAYEQAIRETDTRGLTKVGVELTKRYVTDVLTGAFAEELNKLGFVTPALALQPAGGQKGNLYHQIQLKYAAHASVAKVISDGEARCVALAAFLAELRSAGHASAIIFDDPVSSLDHRWRQKIADRLVEESKLRQVIVFTHEQVFLHALIQAAEHSEVPLNAQSVSRRSDTAGHVEAELPWGALGTKKRLGKLKADWQIAEKVCRTEGEKTYRPHAVSIYARLRQSWERAVEEVLLEGVVERFRPSIETMRLKSLSDIQDADMDAVTAGMTKCSKWEGGHDHALAVNDPIPSPSELLADITALEQFVKGIQDRRKK